MDKSKLETVATFLGCSVKTGYTLENSRPEYAIIEVENLVGHKTSIWLSPVGLSELIESLKEIENTINY